MPIALNLPTPSPMSDNLLYIPPTQVEWIPPSSPTVKLNFDGGLSKRRGCAISAGIFRDHNGLPLFSYAAAKPEISGDTPYDGEARALLLGFTNLWIEGDAKLLIDVVRSNRPNLWYDEKVVSRIRHLLATHFTQEPRLTFNPREGNQAADALVGYLRDDVCTQDAAFWRREEELPSRVAAIVDRERTGYSYVRKGRSIPRPKGCYFGPAAIAV